MGYHANEETTKKAVKDAYRFINDRERFKHALRECLSARGIPERQRDEIIKNVRECDFNSLHRALGRSQA